MFAIISFRWGENDEVRARSLEGVKVKVCIDGVEKWRDLSSLAKDVLLEMYPEHADSQVNSIGPPKVDGLGQ